MISFRPFTEVTPAEWDATVEASPDAWAWGLSAWRTIILGVEEWELEDFSFAAYEGAQIVAVVPLQYQRRSGRMACTGWGLVGPILAGHLPPEKRPAVLRVVMRQIEALAVEQGATRVETGASALTPASRNAPWGVNPFVPYGYEDTSTHTRILNLNPSVELLWASVSENARRKIKLATKLGFSVQRVDWLAMLDCYYEAHCMTYRRTGVTPHPRRYFEGIARELAPRGNAVLWAAIGGDGEPIAFRNDARCGEGVVYHTGCSQTAALETGANYMLVWEAILGAKRDGFHWYEVGEVFPTANDGKSRGLTEFKSRFGGALHRNFRAVKPIAVAAAPSAEAVAAPPPPADPDEERTLRGAYAHGSLYAPSRICARLGSSNDDYASRLLQERFDLVAECYRGGRLVDLCCATGSQLLDIASTVDEGIGIDFTARYLSEGVARAAKESARVSFVQADARRIPLASGSVDLLYCFSALYAIPGAAQIVDEVGRILSPGGRAILDFGNRRSINVYCLRYYTDWPPVHPLTIAEMRDALDRAGLAIERHRRFQFLPLWAGRPAWLWPLLHPVWQNLCKRRVFGRMIDEWISSLPLLRAFAFRHVIVCRKHAASDASA